MKKVLSLGIDGKLVLKLPNGRVEEIRQSQPIIQTALLLIDCSGSMAGDKLAQARSGAVAFATDALAKGYLIGLIKFSGEALLLCEPTSKIADLQTCIDKLNASGETNMLRAVSLATEKLIKAQGARAILIVTDGMPNDPEKVLSEARFAKEQGIDIIAIGTDDADNTFLSRLASSSALMIKVAPELLAQSIATAARMLPWPAH